MRQVFDRIRTELGTLGLVGLAILAASTGFLVLVLQPLETKHRLLDERLARHARHPDETNLPRGAISSPAAKLNAFYRFFDGEADPTDSLARIHGVAKARGIGLRQGEYRPLASEGRLERYQIVLPIAGNYGQVRGFLEDVLAEIPVLSLDQAVMRRARANASLVETEVTMTLHRLRR